MLSSISKWSRLVSSRLLVKICRIGNSFPRSSSRNGTALALWQSAKKIKTHASSSKSFFILLLKWMAHIEQARIENSGHVWRSWCVRE